MKTKSFPSARAGWDVEMRSLFKRARFREANALYNEAVAGGQRPLPELSLLNARALLSLNDPNAREFLSQQRSLISSPSAQFEFNLYLGVAHARFRDFEQADKHLDAAASRRLSARERAQYAYHLTRRYLLEKRLDEAWKTWPGTLADESKYGKIRSEHLRSFMLSHEERYPEQAASLLRVLELIGSNRKDYLEEWYWAVQTLAGLARELPIAGAKAAVERELDADIEWSPDFRVNRFQALKSLGWCQALTGNQLGCFRYLREAQDLDVPRPWKAIVVLDRSYFARSVGEEQWALNELLAAEELSSNIAWEEYSGEERVGLLLFAELFSAIDPKKAKRYLDRHDNLQELRSPLILGAFDRRMRALRDYSAGVVCAAEGSREEAIDLLRSAWGVFDSIGYDWRAGRAAMRLLEVTGKTRWRHLAEEKLESYPQSWLAREIQRSSGLEHQPRLPRMQQKIFEMLCAGMSTDDIAEKLGRSHYTVRNHIKLIFKAFGVNSRHSLVAVAAKKNLIA
jgi:DNA-binding CsgD family transcriptional regulator